MTEIVGVGECPKRAEGLGHVWVSWRADPRRSCEFCGRPGRDGKDETGGYFGQVTGGRVDFFSGMKAPMQSGTGDPSKAWPAPKGTPPLVAAKVAEIIADKKRRDAEAVASGTARPGQIAGARAKR